MTYKLGFLHRSLGYVEPDVSQLPFGCCSVLTFTSVCSYLRMRMWQLAMDLPMSRSVMCTLVVVCMAQCSSLYNVLLLFIVRHSTVPEQICDTTLSYASLHRRDLSLVMVVVISEHL